MNAWAALETALAQEPLFFCEKPDGRRDLGELARVIDLRNLVRECGKGIKVHAIPNAGKRGFKAQRQAKSEGMVAGVFDLCFTWPRGGVCWIEMKGYASRRAGSLSDAQIAWGNEHYLMGHAVACFFSPEKALDWLRDQGAPVLRASFQNGPSGAANAARSFTKAKGLPDE